MYIYIYIYIEREREKEIERERKIDKDNGWSIFITCPSKYCGKNS